MIAVSKIINHGCSQSLYVSLQILLYSLLFLGASHRGGPRSLTCYFLFLFYRFSSRLMGRQGLLSSLTPAHSVQRPALFRYGSARCLTSKITIQSLSSTPELQSFIQEYKDMCQPKEVYICDGSPEELSALTDHMVDTGVIRRLKHPSYENW